ncbi:MAG: hypothetical protein IGS49_29745 [Chlorogloeopsis fritschii C42_A2020_084]|uniref:hypothetical protein n=1 Tax=Chlorogloeopsis fritschii TaxID=1124 RepID=UPI0019F0A9C1|nr:hypothetical protein [Chlorogloeopsis fritschii]MBF2009494.1 hypothetical protein [Chlorogloeopsis fritschii C42_A2020_084]
MKQRGTAPQLLGQSSIDGETLQFRIEFTSDVLQERLCQRTGIAGERGDRNPI